MTDAPSSPPSAAKLLRRLSTPSPPTALESLGLPEAHTPTGDAHQRLVAAERLLKRLASGTPDIDEATIDRIIRDAEEALKKLDGEGEQAPLSEGEAFGLEAVIEADGSRPVLFVQDGTIDLEAPDLKESLAERWQMAAGEFLPGIRKIAASVGAVQLPAFGNRRFGTAFLIKPGYVVTNRHVLEEAARFVDGAWRRKYEAEVDFLGEYQRADENRFPLGEVVFWGGVLGTGRDQPPDQFRPSRPGRDPARRGLGEAASAA
jgi:S1-C subfamily serine protease